jgi:hypothetical protein
LVAHEWLQSALGQQKCLPNCQTEVIPASSNLESKLRICSGVSSVSLHRAGSRWQDGFDGADVYFVKVMLCLAAVKYLATADHWYSILVPLTCSVIWWRCDSWFGQCTLPTGEQDVVNTWFFSLFSVFSGICTDDSWTSVLQHVQFLLWVNGYYLQDIRIPKPRPARRGMRRTTQHTCHTSNGPINVPPNCCRNMTFKQYRNQSTKWLLDLVLPKTYNSLPPGPQKIFLPLLIDPTTPFTSSIPLGSQKGCLSIASSSNPMVWESLTLLSTLSLDVTI